jgi:tRNA-dihydrouridine synthase
MSLLPQVNHELPLTALAPMQDVTNLWFMQVLALYGGPDYFFTEYFRVHESSNLKRTILRSITENTTGIPVFAQMIGENLPDLVRTAKELCQHGAAGIDLNLGCPAPRVYRKNVGGGLLREPEKIDRILGALRDVVSDRPLTVKMRLGFDSVEGFETLLNVVGRHGVDLVSLHGRTVQAMYGGEVDYGLIGDAVERLDCPVLANGNVFSATRAVDVLDKTGAAGVMVGRWAIGNPWIFQQIRQALRGEAISVVSLLAVREYIDRLWNTPTVEDVPERARVGYMKMFLNYIALGVDAEGRFLRESRQAQSEVEFFGVCDRFLLRGGDFGVEPFRGGDRERLVVK